MKETVTAEQKNKASAARCGACPENGENTEQSLGKLFSGFRKNGLGLADSFFNALYIRAVEKDKSPRFVGFLTALPRTARKISFRKARAKNALEGKKKAKDTAFKKFIGAVPALLLIALIAAGVFLVNDSLSKQVFISVETGGKKLGTVESKESMERILRNLETSVGSILEADFSFPYSIKYTLSEAGASELTPKKDITQALYEMLHDYVAVAHGLYIDGIFVGAMDSAGMIDTVLADYLNEKKAETGDSGLIYYNDITVREQSYPVGSILNADSMNALLHELSQNTVSEKNERVKNIPEKGEEKGEEAFLATRLISDAELGAEAESAKRLSGKTDISDLRIIFCTVKEVTYDETVPYDTVYVEDPSLFTSMADIKVYGYNGSRRVTARVYVADGVEIKRETVSETVTAEPGNCVIHVGTRIMPEDLIAMGITDFYGDYIIPHIHIVSSFFYDTDGRDHPHQGWDIADKLGQNIYASRSGTVVTAIGPEYWHSIYTNKTYSGYGHCVVIDHGDGWFTLYAHCGNIMVDVGDVVKQGDKIAEIGITGVTDGPHVHFEIIEGETKRDPGAGYIYAGMTSIYDIKQK